MKPQFRLLLAFALAALLAGACSTSITPTPSPAQTGTESITPTAATAATVAEAAPMVAAATANPFLYSDAPARSGYPNTWTILKNIAYESAYDETFKNPAWVAYHLHGTEGTSAPRPNGYITDTRTVSKVAAAEYPPGYDHGHMAPNSAIGRFFSDAAQKETFLMSNMLPQKHELNAGPWELEEALEYSKWEPKFHDVWIIDGPVYTTANDQPINPTNRYGAKQVCIPVACFKVVIAKRSNGDLQTLAFIMPQNPGPGHKPAEYLTSIRTVERRTGLNFFSSLPKVKQDAIETPTASVVWP